MNTILKKIQIVAVALIIFSCAGDSKNQKTDNTNTAQEDSLKLKLNTKKYKASKLNAQADSLTKDWPMYESVKNEVERLEEYNIQDVISNISTLRQAVDSLQKTIPKAVDTFPVTSRLNVLNTKAEYLLLLSDKQQPKLKKIKAIAEEYPLEFNALNIQLNEVFIKPPKFED